MCLKRFALGRLAAEQEGLGIGALSTDFEGTEVFVPIAFWNFRLGFDPKAKLVEVGKADGSVAHAIHEVIANVLREIVPALDLRHSCAKDHTAQLIAKTLGFCGVGGVAEALSQFEELLLLALFRFDAIFDKLDEHAVRTDPAILRQAPDLSGGIGRESNALPD